MICLDFSMGGDCDETVCRILQLLLQAERVPEVCPARALFVEGVVVTRGCCSRRRASAVWGAGMKARQLLAWRLSACWRSVDSKRVCNARDVMDAGAV